MIISLPAWYSEAREKLDKCVEEIIRENCIDFAFTNDSKTIEDGKGMILNKLLKIAEQVHNPMFPPREEQLAFQKHVKKYLEEKRAKKRKAKLKKKKR